MSLKEYKPGAAFNGVIGRTFDVSSPAWPAPLRAKDGDQPDCNYCSDHQDSGIYDPVSLSIIKVLHGARRGTVTCDRHWMASLAPFVPVNVAFR